MVTDADVPRLRVELVEIAQKLDECAHQLDALEACTGGLERELLRELSLAIHAASSRASKIMEPYTRPHAIDEMGDGRRSEPPLVDPSFSEIVGDVMAQKERARRLDVRCRKLLGWPLNEADERLLAELTV